MYIPNKLIIHYHNCSLKNYGDVLIDHLNVQLFFLNNVLNCTFIEFVEETYPYNNNVSYPYAYNTLERKILYKEEIIDYIKNMYNIDLADNEKYVGVINELQIILLYYLWIDDNIYKKFTKKIYRNNFLFFYYIYITKKLKKEKLQICKRKGLDNNNFNLLRLKKLLDIIDDLINNNVNSKKNKVCYFDSLCFSVLSVFYSIPLKYNDELKNILMSKPNLIKYIKNLNEKYKIWKNENFLSNLNNI